MNEQIKDGGPAFPEVRTFNSWDQSNEMNFPETYSEGGMTLRDYFAAKAMQGDIASMRAEEDPMSVATEIAERAYVIADAMLAAREVKA